MDSLFAHEEQEQQVPDATLSQRAVPAPLADRIRPRSLDEVVGQEHLVGRGAPLRRFFESGSFPSIMFWGPPGVGKTTLALLIAREARYHFVRLSAIESGVKEVRDVIARAEKNRSVKPTLLFIDEIHRFNKSQQDALLHAVEKGIITLIGATTENPSFEVNAALLSRCQVYRLRSLSDDDIRRVVEHAIESDEELRQKQIQIEAWDSLLAISGGDARTALNALDLAIRFAQSDTNGQTIITREVLETVLQQKTAQYDKKGESHYDTISAFIKSLRGSDPDAALFWLAKMIDAGEDPRFIARRMVIFASEDIGNADPQALVLAIAVFQAVEMIGMPEARINLAQGVTYLATAVKSNAAYVAVEEALALVRSGVNTSVPLHLRNAPTQLMKRENYGKEYQYPHSFAGHFVRADYFPEGMTAPVFYRPDVQGNEESIRLRLEQWWAERYTRSSKEQGEVE